MTARVSDYKEDLYVREYSHDAPPQVDLAKRVALAVIPFFSLHPALRFPVSIAMGTLRVWNADHEDVLGTTVAVIALAAAIFCHPVGMVVTTVHSIYLEIRLIQRADDWQQIAKSVLRITCDLVYLSLIIHGGLELSIAAFAMQVVLNGVQSVEEFKNGRWIEGVSNLLMAAVRTKQCHSQCLQLKRNWEIKAALEKIHVGQLHGQWQFPSDHLPVGVEVDGVKIISWNVLNNAYMEWVTDKDSQGLKGSMISDLDVAVQENGLTLRDVVVADMACQMMEQGHIVALQECGQPFLQHLQEKLPDGCGMAKSFSGHRTDQDVILYDKSRLTHQPHFSETSQSAYSSFPGRPLQNVYFSQKNGKDLRIINAHIPGEPSKPGREEFARYVKEQHREGSITVALGDNNFERDEMIEAYRKAGFSEFSLHSPWKTNIDPVTKESKGIDHLFVLGAGRSTDLKPQEVLPSGNLQETIDLLHKAC